MRILLVGHGKMGRMVESLAPEYGCEVIGIVDPRRRRPGRRRRRVAERRRRDRLFHCGRGSDATCPCSPGAASTLCLARPGGAAARRCSGGRSRKAGPRLWPRRISRPASSCSKRSSRALPSCSRGRKTSRAFVHETHHSAKKDAPSGTALLLRAHDGERRIYAGESTWHPRESGSCPEPTRSASMVRPKRLRSPTQPAIARRSRGERWPPRNGSRASAAGSQ